MTIWEILNHDFNLLQCCFYISSFFTLIFNQISNWYIFFLFYRHFVFFEHPPLIFMFSTKCLIFGFVSHKVTMLLDALLLRYLGDIRTHSPDPWCGCVFLLRLYWIQLLCVCNIRICLLTPFISVPLTLITRSHLSAWTWKSTILMVPYLLSTEHQTVLRASLLCTLFTIIMNPLLKLMNSDWLDSV